MHLFGDKDSCRAGFVKKFFVGGDLVDELGNRSGGSFGGSGLGLNGDDEFAERFLHI